MFKKYEVRVKENNEVVRKYALNINDLSNLLREEVSDNIIGVYKLQIVNDIIVGSGQLDWKLKGNILSLKSITKSKTLPSYIIPLTQEQMEKLSAEILSTPSSGEPPLPFPNTDRRQTKRQPQRSKKVNRSGGITRKSESSRNSNMRSRETKRG